MTGVVLLRSYSEFISRADELGFMTLSHALDGLASLGSLTDPSAWHTGDYETDPWQWKDRAAQEKKLAYASCLGAAKGFIAPRLYSTFYAAFHPKQPMEDRWAEGGINQTTWTVWGLFEKERLMNTSEIRAKSGVSLKSGGSRVEGSLDLLQMEFYLTTAGVRQKVAKSGKLYGWPATVFDRVVDWAPSEWLADAPNWDPRGARETILEMGVTANPGMNRKALAALLKI